MITVNFILEEFHCIWSVSTSLQREKVMDYSANESSLQMRRELNEPFDRRCWCCWGLEELDSFLGGVDSFLWGVDSFLCGVDSFLWGVDSFLGEVDSFLASLEVVDSFLASLEVVDSFLASLAELDSFLASLAELDSFLVSLESGAKSWLRLRSSFAEDEINICFRSRVCDFRSSSSYEFVLEHWFKRGKRY